MIARGIPAAAAGVGVCVVALAGWGTVRPRDRTADVHPTVLDGAGWAELSLRERELVVQGFVLGAAAEQAIDGIALEPPRAAQAGPTERTDGPAELARGAREVATRIGRLREERALRFAYAPALLARRLDEFYWWRDNADVPVAGALAEVNRRLREEGF